MTEAEIFEFCCWIYQNHFGMGYPMQNVPILGEAKCCKHIKQCVIAGMLAEDYPYQEDVIPEETVEPEEDIG